MKHISGHRGLQEENCVIQIYMNWTWHVLPFFKDVKLQIHMKTLLAQKHSDILFRITIVWFISVNYATFHPIMQSLKSPTMMTLWIHFTVMIHEEDTFKENVPTDWIDIGVNMAYQLPPSQSKSAYACF